MFFPAQPAVPPAIVTKAPAAHALGVCDVLDLSPYSKTSDFSPSPITIAQIYFKDLDIQKTQIQILTAPQHGTLVPAAHRANQPYPSSDLEGTNYYPNTGYTGHDKFALRISDGKYDIVIYYDLQMMDGLPYPNAANQDPWCVGQDFKISSAPTGLNSIAMEDAVGTMIRYANLPGMGLGQEESGTHNAVITLGNGGRGKGDGGK